ncbi:unnamed protein product [Brassica oleracea]|uniref:(rape) hypothetical protein n=1 Tax=Brassica napus TaxID=3708 RepID=A0A816JTA1_BRANA|nr:unnamed protein product [Brassica napus]
MLSQSVPSSSEGIGQSSSGTPLIAHFLFVSPPPLLIRSMKKIQLALSKRGFSGNISIWAYVHEDYEFLKRKKKTWVSNIHFLPGDNDASKRRIRMLNDMQLLSRDSPVRPPDDVVLILVSDHFMGDYTYFEVFISNMENRYYYPVLVVPSEQSEESKQSDDPWPGLLMDGAYHLLHVD